MKGPSAMRNERTKFKCETCSTRGETCLSITWTRHAFCGFRNIRLASRMSMSMSVLPSKNRGLPSSDSPPPFPLFPPLLSFPILCCQLYSWTVSRSFSMPAVPEQQMECERLKTIGGAKKGLGATYPPMLPNAAKGLGKRRAPA